MTKASTVDPQIQELDTEKLSAKITRKPGCTLELDVTVKPKVTEDAYKKAIKAINKEVSIPGFRKGKAPIALIEKNYSSSIHSEWVEKLGENVLAELFKQGLPKPFDRKIAKYELESIDRQEGAIIRMSYQAEPDIPSIVLSELNLTEIFPEKADEKEVEDVIDQILHDHAEWEEIQDQEVEEGTYVDIKVEVLDPPPHTLTPNARVRVDQKIMPKWLYDLVLQKKTGDTVEGTSEKEEERFLSSDLFMPTRCRITINHLWQCHLPECNEEWVKSIGFDDIPSFREAVTNKMIQENENEVFAQMKQQIQEQLVEKFSFDIPGAILEKDQQRRIAMYRENYQAKNYAQEDLERSLQNKEEEIREESRQSLIFTNLIVKLTYDQQFSVTNEELSQELTNQLWRTPLEFRVIHKDMEMEEVRETLAFEIREKKGWQWLIDQLRSSDKDQESNKQEPEK